MARAVAALGLVFLLAHLPFLAPALEDIDSINFAMGVRDFDVAQHRPHPPGYPVFILLGKASTYVFELAGVSGAPARALAVWSTLSGTALVFALLLLFQSLVPDRRRALAATLVTVCCPLFWFTALRPLSDMTGLAAATAAQACLVAALFTTRPIPDRGRALIVGGLLAGLAIGVRSQTFLLTLPLFAVALIFTRVPGAHRLAAMFAASVGVLAWAVPLFIASGGPTDYLAALGSQAGEDFSGVVMLWTTPTARVAIDALAYTFLWPWGSVAAGAAVLALALAGSLHLAVTHPRRLLVLFVAFAPYALFHLLFQETVTVRYALPLVIPMAFLAVWMLGVWRPALVYGSAALAAAFLVAAIPASRAYGRDGSPPFRLFDALRLSRAERVPGRPVFMHAVMRRVYEWHHDAVPEAIAPGTHGREWLALVEHWRQNPGAEVQFVVNPRRTDLALFDPYARKLTQAYGWTFSELPYVGGARPGRADLYTMRPPGWMLDRGWALTAEIAGVTARDGLGPHVQPSTAWVRGRAEGARLLIAGRNLAVSEGTPARISIRTPAAALDSLDVPPGPFFRLVAIAPGQLAGDGYIPVTVSAAAADGSGRQVPTALEQFDLQPDGRVMWGYAAGWNEPEFQPSTAQSWRWMTASGTLWVRPIGRDVTLTLTGESPLRYFDRPTTIRVRAGEREVARLEIASDFEQAVALPGSLLDAADGRVTIEADQSFIPAERGGAADRRQLALRVYSVRIE